MGLTWNSEEPSCGAADWRVRHVVCASSFPVRRTRIGTSSACESLLRGEVAFYGSVENLLPNLAAAFSPSIPNILNWGNQTTKLAIGDQLFFFFFFIPLRSLDVPVTLVSNLLGYPTDLESGPRSEYPS